LADLLIEVSQTQCY